MRKIIVNPRRFSQHKDFRNVRKALINKEKTSNHNGLLVFYILVEMGGVEPPQYSYKTIENTRFYETS